MKKYFSIISIIIFLISTSCSRKNLITVTDRDFTDEVNEFQNLEFKFSQNLAPDSVIDLWDNTEYIQFTPKIAGKFKWSAEDALIFSPSEQFRPNTDYSAIITKETGKFSKKRRMVSKDPIKFHTAYLKLISTTSFWTLSKGNMSTIEVHNLLNFNYPINPKQLDNLLEVYINGTKSKFKLLTKENSENITIAFPTPKVKPAEATPIKIIIQKGLKCIGSGRESVEPFEQISEIPPQDELQITKMIASFEEGVGSINIFTSQPIISKELKKYISITPYIKFQTRLLPNGIQITGNFSEGETFKVTVSGKIKGAFGKDLGESYSQYVTFGNLEPHLAFTEKNSVYLSSKGEKNVGINIVNIPKIKITIFKVFENNIMHYLHEGKSWDYFYDEEDDWHDFYSYPMTERYGKTIFEEEVNTRKLPSNGNIKLLNINLEEIGYSDNLKGLYVIKVESLDKRWLQDEQLVSISDIGLIAKEGANNAMVIVNSIVDATPLSGVTVNFISTNNQNVYSATTNNQGIAELTDMEKTIGDFKIAMVTARNGDDFNYLLFRNNRVETSRFDVGGKRTNNLNYDVFIYGDRDLYRPGDKVYFNTVVRSLDWEAVNDIPIKIKILLPNGKKYLSFKKQLNNEGAAETSFDLPHEIMTGVFTMEVYQGNDVLLKSRTFKVEEFMPDRIKVTTKLNKTEYKPNDEAKVNIAAVNLFGPPAANRKYELEMNLSRKFFYPKKFPDYIFNIKTDRTIYFDTKVSEGKTDAEGKASDYFELPSYKDIGIIQGKIFTTVFDETGRPVNRINQFEINTQDVFYGIKNFDYWLGTKKPLKIGFVAVNKKGKLLKNIPAKVQIKRYYYETVIEKRGNRYIYNSQKREKVVLNRDITVNSKSTYVTYTPMHSGRYEVRIMKKGGKGYVYRNFYAYGWGDTEYSSFEVSKEGEIIIELDKENYNVGDKANVLFKTPFSGRLIVTVERDKILEHHYLTTDKKAASMTLDIGEDFLPNVYISATVIRKMESFNNIPLTVAHGCVALKVDKPSNKLNVEITAVKKSRSKKKQNIKIKTAPNTQVTVAVVDEGILQITAYQSPDPYDYFYQKRALEVNSYDLYASLFPELSSHSSSYAGGTGMDLSKRVNPLTSKRVKLIALWSGILKTNSRGECDFDIDIPKFSGALRVMAVAYKGKKFGSSDHFMKVADPIVISTALPRFISPKDQITIPVTLTNTTNRSTNAKVSISVKGPLKVDQERTATVKLNPNSENQAVFNVIADANIGHAEITITVNGLNEKFIDKTDITVRPAAGLIKITDAGSVKGGQTKTFKAESDFIPKSTSSKLIISRSPIAEFSDDLSFLIRYPYGCIEQTVSAAFPQIYFTDLAKSLNQDPKSEAYKPDYHVQQAVYKVESMQQYNGGLSYWPSGSNVNWWGTVYGAHFLYEAKKAGFNVDNKKLKNIYKYLNQRVKTKNKKDYYYYDNNNVLQHRMIAAKETFYSLFVLALANQQNRSVMNHYKSKLDELSLDSKYMLASSYALIGDKLSYNTILPKAFDGERSRRSLGGSFYSYTRDKSIALYSLLEVDPSNKQVGILARQLSKQLRKRRWMSTQERAFALLALGKFAKRTAGSNVTANIMINGISSGSFSGKDIVIYKNINNKTVQITASGKGHLFYFYEVEGISASGQYTEEDNYMMVRKNFYDRFGNTLKGTSFSQNDLIIIKVSIRALHNEYIENVAITDILPACFEIENPRLSPTREYDWIKDKSYPEYLDVRDDRISFFTTVSVSKRNFYYMVRAVSKGTYQMGPVGADAMYDGEYHSYHGGGTVTVN